MYFFDPKMYELAPKCPFKLLTGLNCPSCGIQRFLHAMLHGRPSEAIQYNYYLAYSLPYAFLLVAGWLLPTGKLKTNLVRIAENRYVVWFYVITFFIWFFVRNLLKI